MARSEQQEAIVSRAVDHEWRFHSGPGPRATKPWQMEQEDHLAYVMLTRAIEEMVYVN